MIQHEIVLNAWSKQPVVLLAVQGESQARRIIATLINSSGAPINMTGKTARMYVEKADKTTVFFDGVTQNALNGIVSFTLPLQATAFAGSTNCQVIVNDATGATLVSYGLKIDVVASKFNSVLESTSEFTALQEALAAVQDIDNRVPKTTTIAGIDLQNNILLSELIAAGLAAGTGGAANNALALGGVDADKVIKNKNLLHNWDFRNPVNTYGLTQYTIITTTSRHYTIDRWRTHMYAGETFTANLQTNGIKTSATVGNYRFSQLIENERLYAGKTVTFSVKYAENSELRCGVGFMYGGVEVANSGWEVRNAGEIVSVTTTLPAYTTSEFRVQWGGQPSGSCVIESAKLEFGSVSTLANDPPADYGEQLALCQRFCSRQIYTTRYRMSYRTANSVVFFVPLPATLRAVPTYIGEIDVCQLTSSTPETGFAFNIALRDGGLYIEAVKTAHGLEDCHLRTYDIIWDANL